MFEAHIQEFFYFNEDAGLGCRCRSYEELIKHYSLSDLLQELMNALGDARSAKTTTPILHALSYVYLFAYFFHQRGALTYASNYVEKYEQAAKPTFLSRLLVFLN